jgi:hypothetical protein
MVIKQSKATPNQMELNNPMPTLFPIEAGPNNKWNE